MSVKNIASAFAKCGIAPLDLAVMKACMIGQAHSTKPTDSEARHVITAMENLAPLHVTKRLRSSWSTKGICADSVVVAYRNIDRFVSFSNPTTAPRMGDFIPESEAKNLLGGGYLVTRDDKYSLLQKQKDTKVEKLKAAAVKRTAKQTAKIMKLQRRAEKDGVRTRKNAASAIVQSQDVCELEILI